jgi:hypothetical protein
MTQYSRSVLLALLLGIGWLGIVQASPPRCAKDALEQAQRLLVFHVGEDDRIEIDPEVVEKASLRNPANKDQTFQVLEVWGTIYKGQYRMRLIYYPLGQECVLMGQEVLEYSSL